MKKAISMFLCMVMIVSMMSGISPIMEAQAAESTDFITEKEAVTDYAYSFAVVGDTQIVTEYDVNNSTGYLSGIYDWILKNKEAKNIEYVFGLGDITDNNKEAEWALAKTQISKLDGKIPYSVVRGNHDLVGYGTAEDKTADYFSKYLGTVDYKEQFSEGGFYSEENIWNSWRTFTVGDVDYLMLALDWGASDAVLSWAGNVISEYSTYNVIITTHGYTFSDGTTVGVGEGGMSTADNNGEAMWEKFVSKYENIVLVLSGHVPSEDIVVSQDEGVNGNIVTSMLVDSQDVDTAEVAAGNTPLGAVAMLYFSEDGRDVQVEYYATARNAYYKENNQFGFELASVSKEVDDCERVVKEYTATEVADYLAKEGEDGYPKLDGYLFAGWYTDEDCDETSALAGKTPSGTTYALFVPKHMLSVKAQISANLIDSDETNNETGSIRFITTIDSLLYKEAGFKISYVNDEGNTVSTTSGSNKALRKLYVLDSTNKWGKTPEGTFCGISKYFKACLLKNVSMSKHYNTVFTLQPYFITLDGDIVYGEPAEKSFAQGCEESKVAINIQTCENGSVIATEDVHWGNTVTLTVSPESEDYLCESLNVNGWDVADDLVANGDGTYSYSFTAMEGSYMVVPKISRRIFANSTTWDVSKQFEGEVSRTTTNGKTMASVVLYDQYTDIDITLDNVKHLAHYDTEKTFGGRMDIMFQFDVDGDGQYTTSTAELESKDRNTSFGIMTTNTGTGTTLVRTLGLAEPYSGAGEAGKGQWITGTTRQKQLYTLTDELEQYNGDGVEFRVIRSGTMAYVYLDDKQVVEFDLTQNNSGVTAETKAIVTLRYYEGVGEVVVPFKISDTVDPIFTTTGATGKWDLTNKYNGVVTVDSTSAGNVVLPLAKKYTDIDMTLSGIKEYSSLHTVENETKYSRTDILFEFDTNGDGTTDKTTSFGIVKDGTNGAAVKTLGIDKKFITVNRANTLYSLDAEEVAKYNNLEQGVELRVVRSGKYIYVFVEGKQVSEFDITQNNSGVTADMEATVSLRHYDVKASGLSFTYAVTDKVEETALSIASNENGIVTTNQVSHLEGTAVVWENSTKHFMGETITLTATPNRGYKCSNLQINNKKIEQDTYTFEATKSQYFVEAEYERRVFADSSTWDVSRQAEGIVTLPGGGTANLPFYDEYTNFDLTLKNVKEYDTTGSKPGRTDVRFEFDIDGDGVFDKNTSFGVMTRDDGYTKVMTLGNDDDKWITTSRAVALYTLTDEEAAAYKGDGITFRIVRFGTDVDICINGKVVAEFDLTQNESGITAGTAATITLRHYDAATDGEVVIPFEVSDVADTIFTREGAAGTWDLTEKYNGVVSVDSNSKSSVVLPFAKKYTDIDLTLSNVKHRDNNVNSEATYGGRTDILFEFNTDDDEDNVTDKTVSFGVMRRDNGETWVRTLGIDKKTITTTRVYELYQLDEAEVEKYNGEGIDFRVIRSGANIYVYIEGKQVAEFDLTQNNSGVTADMEAKVSLRHYDVKAEKIEFSFEVTDEVEEVTLDIASDENGIVTTKTINCVTGDTSVSRDSSKHFMGETVVLEVTPNEGYMCTELLVNGKSVTLDNLSYAFVAERKEYTVKAAYESE